MEKILALPTSGKAKVTEWEFLPAISGRQLMHKTCIHEQKLQRSRTQSYKKNILQLKFNYIQPSIAFDIVSFISIAKTARQSKMPQVNHI